MLSIYNLNKFRSKLDNYYFQSINQFLCKLGRQFSVYYHSFASNKNIAAVELPQHLLSFRKTKINNDINKRRNEGVHICNLILINKR